MMRGKLGDCGGTFLFPRHAFRVECGASVISWEEPEPLNSTHAPRMADHTCLTHGYAAFFVYCLHEDVHMYTHGVYSTHLLARSLTRAHTHIGTDPDQRKP